MSKSSTAIHTKREKALAWGVHTFTATGALWGLLGLIAVIEQNWRMVFLWMIVATFVDGVDGMLARKFRVKVILPGFDGALLDNILDYLTYVIIPALFLYHGEGYLPAGWQLAGSGLVAMASAYQFCQADAKTDDHTFKGFPSYWNIVVFYFYVLNLNPWVNLAIVVALAILVFVPIKYAYPSRMVRYQKPTIVLTVIWGFFMIAAWALSPNPPSWIVYISLIYPIYYLFISAYMMVDKK